MKAHILFLVFGLSYFLAQHILISDGEGLNSGLNEQQYREQYPAHSIRVLRNKTMCGTWYKLRSEGLCRHVCKFCVRRLLPRPSPSMNAMILHKVSHGHATKDWGSTYLPPTNRCKFNAHGSSTREVINGQESPTISKNDRRRCVHGCIPYYTIILGSKRVHRSNGMQVREGVVPSTSDGGYTFHEPLCIIHKVPYTRVELDEQGMRDKSSHRCPEGTARHPEGAHGVWAG